MVAGGVVDGGLDRSVVVSWFDGSVGGLVGSNVVGGSFGSLRLFYGCSYMLHLSGR